MASPIETQPAIEVRDLVKRYQKAKINAVDGVTFNVRRGEIFGLLGPNGAGKTTTIGVLITSVLPTAGSAARSWASTWPTIPSASSSASPWCRSRAISTAACKVREILTFHAAYHGVPRKEREARADKLLDELGLGDRKNEKVNRYSGGMAQRLMIARALMHAPDVLFLDEPTNNLDPAVAPVPLGPHPRAERAGLTILLTTHDMDEADQLCERIAIMDHGQDPGERHVRGIEEDDPGRQRAGNPRSLPDSTWTRASLEALRGLPGVNKVDELDCPAATSARPCEPGAAAPGCRDVPVVLREYAQAPVAGRPRGAGRARRRRRGARPAREASHARRSLHLSHREAPALMQFALPLLARPSPPSRHPAARPGGHRPRVHRRSFCRP